MLFRKVSFEELEEEKRTAKTSKMLEIEARFGKPMKDILLDLYNEKEMSQEDIAKRFNSSTYLVHDALQKCDIPLRSISKAQLIRRKKDTLYSRENLLQIGIREYLLNSEEWMSRRDLPSLSVITNRFGSWRGFRKNLDEFVEERGINIQETLDPEKLSQELISVLPKSIRQKYDNLNPYEKTKFLLTLKENPQILKDPSIKACPAVGKNPGKRLLIDLNTIIISRYLLEQYVKWIWSDPIKFLLSIYFGGNQLRVFVNSCNPRNGKYLVGEKGPYNNFYYLRYRRLGLNGVKSLLEMMSTDVDEPLVKKAKKIDNGSRLVEFCLEKYIEYYWDNPEGDGQGKRINFYCFIKNRDPQTNEYLGIEKGTLLNRLYTYDFQRFKKKGEDFLEYFERTKDIDPQLITKTKSLDNGTRLKEYLVENYVKLFWEEPFPQGGHQGPPTKKTLKIFVNSRNHKTGTYMHRRQMCQKVMKAYYKTTKKEKQEFFDWMTQDLNPELVRKARLIDSGERAEQYLEEKIREGAEQYVMGVV